MLFLLVAIAAAMAAVSDGYNVCVDGDVATEGKTFSVDELRAWLRKARDGQLGNGAPAVSSESTKPPSPPREACTYECLDCCLPGFGQAVDIKGSFDIHRRLQGAAKISFSAGSVAEAHFRDGLAHGLARTFELWYATLNLTSVAMYREGVPVGVAWRFCEEKGFLVGANNFTGDDVWYIYPGLEVALRGRFVLGRMVRAREARVVGAACSNGVMIPVLNDVSNSDDEDGVFYEFDPANVTHMSSKPLLRDPLEKEFLEVLPSTVANAGDGVFVVRNVSRGSVVGFFNGVRISLEDVYRQRSHGDSVYKIWNDWDDTDQLIDVPEAFRSVQAYNASVGHKINHSGAANVVYGFIAHPRFGRVRSVVAARDLVAGEELFSEYGRTVDGGVFLRQVMRDVMRYSDLSDPGAQRQFLGAALGDYVKMAGDVVAFDPASTFKAGHHDEEGHNNVP